MFVILICFVTLFAIHVTLSKTVNDYDSYEYSFYIILLSFIILFVYDAQVRGLI